MNDLFGLSMTYIMIGLLIVLGVAVVLVGWVMLRNRVMFFMGVRNIPRRRAQTILIIIGLMLSTVIISTAFSIGDTVDYSITNQAYSHLRSVDEIVQATASDQDSGDPFSGGGVQSVTSARPIPAETAQRLATQARTLDGVDGAVAVIRAPVAVSDARSGQTEPNVILAGVDPDGMQGFTSDIRSTDGRELSLGDLASGEIYVNKSAQNKLDILKGDSIQVFAAGRPTTFIVKEIVDDTVLSGDTMSVSRGMVVSLSTAQQILDRAGEVDFIAVSNTGGVRDGIDGSDKVKTELNAMLAGTSWSAATTKKDAVELASLLASFLTTFFVVLGLFAISAGMLLIFLIFVMLAAERRVEMGMVRAIGTKRRHLIQMFLSEGMAYNVIAAAVGCGLGIAVSLIMVRVMAALFADFGLSIVFHVTARSLVVSYSLGVVLTFLTVTFSSWRISNLNIVAAIREITDSTTKDAGRWALGIGVGLSVIGGLLMALGLQIEQGFPFGVGFTAVLIGVTQIARFARVPNRAAFTAMGVVMLVGWLLLAGGAILKNLNGGIEMFFLSGLTMILSSTFVLVYNADLMLALLTRLGERFSSILPSIRTAVAYPMANKFRTGMTIAMISLVMFALVMMSTMNTNFSRIYLGSAAIGGYDLLVNENPSNHIDDIARALDTSGGEGRAAAAAIVTDDQVKQANSTVAEVRMAPTPDQSGNSGSASDAKFAFYTMFGPSESFIKNNEIALQSRANIPGLDSDTAVWQYMLTHADTAIIDDRAIADDGGFGGPAFSLTGVKQGDKTFEPISVQIRDGSDPSTLRTVQIIGIVAPKASALFGGLFIAPKTFDEIFERPAAILHVVKLHPGTDAVAAARIIEKTLLSQGVQADSLRKILDDMQASNRGFMYLIQGFMGIGLFVGIAAVGVIAFRTVVERRQQIGMLRAIGYTKNAIALSFIMESSFVALLGIVSGIGLALLLAYQLLNSAEMGNAGIDGFYIPWSQIIPTGLFAFLASLLMTIIPSRQASSIPIAEALRYE
jgi:putative ABC transport system permease protein